MKYEGIKHYIWRNNIRVIVTALKVGSLRVTSFQHPSTTPYGQDFRIGPGTRTPWSISRSCGWPFSSDSTWSWYPSKSRESFSTQFELTMAGLLHLFRQWSPWLHLAIPAQLPDHRAVTVQLQDHRAVPAQLRAHLAVHKGRTLLEQQKDRKENENFWSIQSTFNIFSQNQNFKQN